MNSFHLLLLGTLAMLGGVALIIQARWRSMKLEISMRERHQHPHTMAGTRWLVVGALALLLGVTHGGEPAYFVGFWEDVLLHVGIIAGCWVATAARADTFGRRADSVILAK
jgi:hypothetical protein